MLKKILSFVLLFTIASCSSNPDDEGFFRDRRYDYRRVEDTSRMVVPEKMDQQSIVDIYPISELSPYASKELIDYPPLPPAVVSDSRQLVKIQRMGEEEWVYIQTSPSQLWPRLKQFLSLENFLVTMEHGGLGIIEVTAEARAEQGIYRFKVEQGFQRNTSELLVRYMRSTASSDGFWPKQSDDVTLEQELIKTAAQFFADTSDKPAYSYAAQGISAQKKLVMQQQENGSANLVLLVGKNRAIASVKNALEFAEFSVAEFDVDISAFKVQYLPQLPESQQPGFFKRMFGFKKKPYNKNVPYAGRFYMVGVQAVSEGQHILIKLDDSIEQDQAVTNKELELMLSLIRGNLY